MTNPSFPEPRILLVDDDRDFAAALARALQGARDRLAVAHSGPEALARLEQQPADILLMDMRMPGMDGLELLRQVGRLYPDAISVAITAHGDLSLAVEAMRLGASDFLQKPFDLAALRRALDGAASRWRLRRELRLANQELRDLNTELEQRVADRAGDLMGALQEAQDANRAKNLFIAVTSHELRTPLQNMMGLTELLRRAPLDVPQQRQVEILRDQQQLLVQILNDLLDFTRLQSGQLSLKPTPFSPRQVVGSILDSFMPAARAAGLDLQLNLADDVPECVVGDPGRLRQILDNLLSNAIKYAGHGCITLALGVARDRPAAGLPLEMVGAPAAPPPITLRFQVKDVGRGIPAEFLPRIFKEYERGAAGLYQPDQGAGLGLAICKNLCRLMGGDIQVESREGVGTVFRVELPFVPADPALAPKPALPGADLAAINPEFARRHPVRILIAEDNPVCAEILIQYLELFGFKPATIQIARNGAEAVNLVTRANGRPGRRQTLVDLVFMDINMPGLDGLEATRQIRAWEIQRSAVAAQRSAKPGRVHRKPTLVIGCTANALPEEHDRCRAAGMDDYLAKPILPQDLQRLFDELILDPSTQPKASVKAARAHAPDVAPAPTVNDQVLPAPSPRVVKAFHQDTPAVLQRLRHELTSVAPETWQATLHYLKNSCLVMRNDDMVRLCVRLQDQGLFISERERLDLAAALESAFANVPRA